MAARGGEAVGAWCLGLAICRPGRAARAAYVGAARAAVIAS